MSGDPLGGVLMCLREAGRGDLAECVFRFAQDVRPHFEPMRQLTPGDAALIERAMFLTFQHHGWEYDCEMCNDLFRDFNHEPSTIGQML